MSQDNEYDIVVIGSGIAGSATAMVLSQVGLRILVIEKNSHPRFAIGESTVPTTTTLLNFLGSEYKVPELAEVGHYLGLRKNGCAAWPKHEFWYGCHREGEPLPDAHQLMFEAFVLPNGPDVHMLRSDVDATGHSSLDDLLDPGDVFRFRKDAGTMHHCFDGGWVWVIPFDNGTTSVGFEFDRDRFPLDPEVSAETEIARLLRRFPTIEAHLGEMRPLRPLVRTDRIQFTSKRMLGEGFILTPHATAFVEPLFSTGLVMTLAFCARFAKLARVAHETKDWRHEQFRPLEDTFFAEVAHVDRLIDGCIQAGGNYDVYKQCWRSWIIGTMAQFSLCVLTRGAPDGPMLYGAGVEGFSEALERVRCLVRADSGADPRRLAAEVGEIIEPFWKRICQPLFTTLGDWSIGSPDPCSPVATPVDREVFVAWFRDKILPEYAGAGDAVQLDNALRWLGESRDKLDEQRDAYRNSRSQDSDYHHAYDRVIATRIPGKFDYRQLLCLD